ncbi:RBPJ-interacting and tubulin-associated protein 1 [Opisthocomus hoazin]|uniref:RBPJ-interacting and tubulin-associated protein 1 n=1 Tax=Opisthocomus hoazin TaxID=30419 RepID=UPI003F52DD6A
MWAVDPAPGGGSVRAAPRGARGRGPRRARPSFVDESLFGSPAGARPPPPAFPTPWAAAPGGGGGSRPRTQRRLPRPAPSFCDEALFGAQSAGPRAADVAKLRALLWSPSPGSRSSEPRSRDRPLQAIHPPAPAAAGSESRPERPGSGVGSVGRGHPVPARSRSLSRLKTPLDGLPMAPGTPKTEKWKKQSPQPAPAAPRGPLMRGRSKSVSGAPPAWRPLAAGGCSPRPPWR